LTILEDWRTESTMAMKQSRSSWKIFGKERLAIDCRALALFRMGIGFLFALDCFMRLRDAEAHYSDTGIAPRAVRWAELTMSGKHGVWSLFFLDGSVAWSYALLLLGIAAGLMLCLGWRTKTATSICWILSLSLRMRMPHLGDGGDILLQLFFFWGLFLPLGERYSLDRHFYFKGRPPAASVFSAGSIALLLQICFVYWFAAAAKTDASWRLHGTALQQALKLESITTSFGAWAADWPVLVLQALTHLTLLIEEFGPIAALLLPLRAPLRLAGPCAMILLHLGIAFCFTFGIFPWVAIVGWFLFIPTPACEAMETVLMRQRRIPPYEPSMLFASRVSNIVATACICVTGLLLITSLPALNVAVPAPIKLFAQASGLQQNWNFFAPRVRAEDGWIMVKATLADGSLVDIWQQSSPPSFSKPPSILASYRGKRWRQHLSYMFHYRNALLTDAFASWLERRWNETHPANPVKSMEVYFLLQNTVRQSADAIPVQLYPVQDLGAGGKAVFAGDPRYPSPKK
jgi:hypothetical protein